MPRRTPASTRVLTSLTLTAVAVGAVAVAAVAISPAAAGASPGDPTTPLAAAPSWIATTHSGGAVEPTTPLSLTVALSLRDTAGAEAFVRSVSDPKSPQYGSYLTPGQYTARFAATDRTAQSVAAYLRSRGLRVGALPQSRAYLPVSGTAAAVDAAFGTGLRTYRRGGRTVIAPSRATTVPSSLRGSVSAVLGLDTSARLRTFHEGIRSSSKHVSTDCSAYYGQNYYPKVPRGKTPLRRTLPTYLCGYTPGQLQELRRTPATGLTGAGVKVGITLWCNDPRIEKDTNRWAKASGWPTLKPGQYTVLPPLNPYNSTYCDDTASGGINVEQALDTQAVHGAAPGADIVYSAATAPFDYALIAALHRLIDSNRVDVITNSWGEVEDALNPARLGAYRDVFLQAAAQGISVLYSSGDNGDNTDGDVSAHAAHANYPASDPWITSVGGTSVAPANASGSRLAFETGWDTGYSLHGTGGWSDWAYLFGGGGGFSKVFPEPYYQKGVVTSRYLGRPAARAYPDLANVADPYTGYTIGYHDAASGQFTLSSIGGTSLSSPYTAGTIALAVQGGRHRRVGFVNPTLYSPSHGGLRDLTDNSLTRGFEYVSGSDSTVLIGINAQRVLDQTLRIGTGWDSITGVGVPARTSVFVDALRAGHTG